MVAGCDALLSPAGGRDTGYLAVHVSIAAWSGSRISATSSRRSCATSADGRTGASAISAPPRTSPPPTRDGALPGGAGPAGPAGGLHQPVRRPGGARRRARDRRPASGRRRRRDGVSAPHLYRWAPALAATLPRLELGHGPTTVRVLPRASRARRSGSRRRGVRRRGWGRQQGPQARAGRSPTRAAATGRDPDLRAGSVTAWPPPATPRPTACAPSWRWWTSPSYDVAANYGCARPPRALTAPARPPARRWRWRGSCPATACPTSCRPAAPPVGALGYVEAAFEIAEQARSGVLPSWAPSCARWGPGERWPASCWDCAWPACPTRRVEGVVVSDAPPR